MLALLITALAVLIGVALPGAPLDLDGCRSSQLRLESGPPISEMTQQATRLFVVRNRSHRACELDGHPRVELLDAHGTPLGFRFRRRGDQELTSARAAPVRVVAGGVAYFAINKNACVGFTRVIAARVRVRLPGQHVSLALGLARYPLLDYCPRADPGHAVDITPIEPTARAVWRLY